tara:strand:- start:372 stop:545 length:174 start_codon:yes stop_codon:yes gene_type:complete
MSKTKTIRVKYSDAFIIEQAVRELAAELQREIKVSDFLTELTKHAETAKKDIKSQFK